MPSSDSSLSSVASNTSQVLPQLPSEHDRPLILQPPSPYSVLSSSNSELFTKGLFSRTQLDVIPGKIQYQCRQPGCNYQPPAVSVSVTTTTNLWTHLKRHHYLVWKQYRGQKQDSTLSTSASNSSVPVSDFFQPRIAQTGTTSAKFREAVLAFIIANNLPFQLVERESFHRLIESLTPLLYSLSASTLSRELYRKFAVQKHKLAVELQHYVFIGGRISLTTDA